MSRRVCRRLGVKSLGSCRLLREWNPRGLRRVLPWVQKSSCLRGHFSRPFCRMIDRVGPDRVACRRTFSSVGGGGLLRFPPHFALLFRFFLFEASPRVVHQVDVDDARARFMP